MMWPTSSRGQISGGQISWTTRTTSKIVCEWQWLCILQRRQRLIFGQRRKCRNKIKYIYNKNKHVHIIFILLLVSTFKWFMNTFYLVDSNGTCAKIVQETHHLHCKWMYPSDKETRIGWRTSPIPPLVSSTSHIASSGGPTSALGMLACLRHKIIMRRLDEEGSVHLSESRINHALPAGLIIHITKLFIHPPPMCDLAVMHGSWNVEKRQWEWSRQGKKQRLMSRSDHASTCCKNKPGSRYFISRLLQVQLGPVHSGPHIG